MLSNIIILLLKSPPHFLSPIPQHIPLLLTISLICGFYLNVYPKYFNWFTCSIFLPSQFHSFSSLFLFFLWNTIIFVFSTFISSFFFLTYFHRFVIISFISLSLFAAITKFLPTTLPSACAFFTISSIHYNTFR
jgi:hypothetical protein